MGLNMKATISLNIITIILNIIGIVAFTLFLLMAQALVVVTEDNLTEQIILSIGFILADAIASIGLIVTLIRATKGRKEDKKQ